MEIVLAIVAGIVLGIVWHVKHGPTKKCIRCRSVIDWEATVCPYCRRSQHKGNTSDGLFFKCMLCVIVCLIVTVAVCAGLGIYE